MVSPLGPQHSPQPACGHRRDNENFFEPPALEPLSMQELQELLEQAPSSQFLDRASSVIPGGGTPCGEGLGLIFAGLFRAANAAKEKAACQQESATEMAEVTQLFRKDIGQ